MSPIFSIHPTELCRAEHGNVISRRVAVGGPPGDSAPPPAQIRRRLRRSANGKGRIAPRVSIPTMVEGSSAAGFKRWSDEVHQRLNTANGIARERSRCLRYDKNRDRRPLGRNARGTGIGCRRIQARRMFHEDRRPPADAIAIMERKAGSPSFVGRFGRAEISLGLLLARSSPPPANSVRSRSNLDAFPGRRDPTGSVEKADSLRA